MRRKASLVSPDEITSPKIQKLIRDMSETLRGIDIGIGLAAPQVGVSIALFLVSKEALLSKRDQEKLDAEKMKASKKSKNWKHLVFINPEIVKSSKKKRKLVEGCLSVNDKEGNLISGFVGRLEKLTVVARDEKGKKFMRGASGLFAQVIQHEYDHLNGVLFIDKAEKIEKMKLDDNGK